MSNRISDLIFGEVRSVDGSKITVKANVLNCVNNQQNFHVDVGAFVNCGGGHGDTICTITRVLIEEIERKETVVENQIVELAIVGSINAQGKFTRGIDKLPPIKCSVYLLNGDQINNLMGVTINRHEGQEQMPFKHFKVGKRPIVGAGEVYLDLDKLLGRHVAILGTTGSGKSCTVATIVQSILRDYSYPRMIFFDIHNEYANAFSEEWEAKSHCVTWETFSLPYWFLDLEEFLAIYHPDAGSNQKAEIKKIIEELKRETCDEQNVKDRISVDSPVYFDIDILIEKIVIKKTPLSPSNQEPWNKMLLKIENINNDTRYNFLRKDMEQKLSLENYFISLFGLNPEHPSYITVLDLSGLPSEVTTVCIGVLSRLCFDYCYWDIDPENLPLALIMEEAHNYIPEDDKSKYSLCRDRVEKIAKEGRKYGLSLIVVSQRPSNVSTTVLSQCGTFITLRLTSDLDQNKIRRLLPDTLGDQANILPSLRDGEALVTGDAVTLPGKVFFNEPNPWPKSNDVRFHKSWTAGLPVGYNVATIINSWKLSEKNRNVGDVE
ncbi:ATP-binding protein [Desulfosporosinus sp. BG]|uniref:ATP-binding protein n=1 Tax=Desulfosporosinus sp. BG TaxID=1633135 RepID=UPI00083B4B83|nr:ATP-binding protein [Desulfosporosinus sp. BG]ODA43021.1 Bipolar DNA helicase HerA [Desulfosporosinus sp. BG]